jgi:DNA-binding GntR family transcriptional regulator
MEKASLTIRPPALRRNVAEVLRSALLEGRYQPGEELSDTRLAAEFGVSRGPVREALLLLVDEGLVLHHQNRGFEVPRLDREDLNQIVAVRRPLEVLALEAARARSTPAGIERLHELRRELVDAFRHGGIKVCALPDSSFHYAVWEMSGNRWLEAALARVSMPYFAYVAAFGLGRRDHSAKLMNEMHERYIAYVEGRSSESAIECVDFHLGLE